MYTTRGHYTTLLELQEDDCLHPILPGNNNSLWLINVNNLAESKSSLWVCNGTHYESVLFSSIFINMVIDDHYFTRWSILIHCHGKYWRCNYIILMVFICCFPVFREEDENLITQITASIWLIAYWIMLLCKESQNTW